MITTQSQETDRSLRAKAARFYLPELDVVRLLAFAAVFLHHVLPRDISRERNGIAGHLSSDGKAILAGTANAFGFGLPLFFCLSAHLIGALLLREKESKDSRSCRVDLA
jgi:peptidoglycan/LPS O-acetylase OafA/YrhL